MGDVFDVDELEQGYAFLDDCPDEFLPEIVTLPLGSLESRVRGIRAWRDCLLDGRLPPVGTWPSPEIGNPARKAIDSLGFLRFCKGQPELVDALLHSVLRSFARQVDEVRADIVRRLHGLEQLERRRLDLEEKRQEGHSRKLSPATMVRLRKQAENDAAQRPTKEDEAIITEWSERIRAWAAIADVFGDLGLMLGRGWDLSVGVLKHTGWSDLLRLRELVAQLPQLKEIVRSLGRLQASDAGEAVIETVFMPIRRLEEELREVPSPHVPAETRGIERSGEIARMLPVEAANLGHPKLKYLWHARRAERALLTYRVEGIEIERTCVEKDTEEPMERKTPRPQRGPIVAVVDTSGSMHGLPERVAKALVLEALRTAHEEKRRCYLYSYSGPGQVLEQELDVSPEGVGRLLTFLGQSFGGGTDVVDVVGKVQVRLDEKAWEKADVLFVSDGEFPVPTAIAASAAKATEAGTRFHGVQIGNTGTTGLHAICKPVHVFRDWAHAGGWTRA